MPEKMPPPHSQRRRPHRPERPEQSRPEQARLQLPTSVFAPPIELGQAKGQKQEEGLLAAIPDKLAAVFPTAGKDKRLLALNIARLSENLTSRRGELAGHSYWSEASLAGAYLWYFLPWNLLRLTSLLSGPRLALPAAAKILDLGSGPLTLPLALWLCRQDLREQPLSFTCLDSSAQALRLGKELFQALAGADSPWRFRLVSENILSTLPRQEQDFSLVTACNVLNELKPARHVTLARHLDLHVENLMRRLAPGGRLLIVEPGNRLGGKIVSLARAAALGHGHDILAPCTHDGPCPLLPWQAAHEGQSQHGTARERGHSAWCHFTLPKEAAAPPPWLDKLSREAGLSKEKLTLSWLLLEKGPDSAEKEAAGRRHPGHELGNAPLAAPAALPGRVVSNALPLPGQNGKAYYVCSARGLVLLHSSRSLRSGESVELHFTADARKDPKSGAWIVGEEPPARPTHPHTTQQTQAKPAQSIQPKSTQPPQVRPPKPKTARQVAGQELRRKPARPDSKTRRK